MPSASRSATAVAVTLPIIEFSLVWAGSRARLDPLFYSRPSIFQIFCSRFILFQLCHCGMNSQQLGNRTGVASPEAAFGRDGELWRVFSRDREALPGALDAIGIVHEAEAELGLRLQHELPERLEISIVRAITRHRHVD